MSSKTFLGLEETSGVENAAFIILPVPFEATTSYLKGCALGPDAILDASAQVETYDEEAAVEPHVAGIHTHGPAGGESSPETLPGELKALIEPWVRARRFTVVLGGEHSVSLGPVQACLAAHPDLSVLQIDAHADLRDEYEGTPLSHACIGRRIQELAPLVQVGIRSLSAEEASALPSLNVKSFFRKDHRPLTEETVAEVLSSLSDSVYLSLDIDAFDPAFAPATGTPEPGGLDWHEFSLLARALALKKNVVGMDVCEVKPNPGDVRTQFLAARAILRIMAWTRKKSELDSL
ncbi:MAG: agmatinase [Planctomycetota bacterium]|jgi:agmatinase